MEAAREGAREDAGMPTSLDLDRDGLTRVPLTRGGIRHGVRLGRAMLLGALLATAPWACTAPPNTGSLSSSDSAAIRAIDAAFVRGWLQDDTAAVLALFSPDAQLHPPGAHAVQGRAAIRAYWWPTDGSHTRITSFTRREERIAGSPTLAMLRTAAELSWESVSATGHTAQTSRSTDIVLLSTDSTGHWRIVEQIWVPTPD